MTAPSCRFCNAPLRDTFCDLGMSPLCESFVAVDALNDMEPFYPLHVRVCRDCFLVQLQEYVAPARIFTEYAYFSSYSTAWLQHAADYTAMISARLGLGPRSQVVELGSNDGYLLQYFVRRGIAALGIEPAANVARAATAHGVETLVRFFDEALAAALAAEGRAADLVIGNNILAQVPNVNSFVAGIRALLKPSGTATLEFPHLQRLIERNQFDTIYHEHFSYFSFVTVERLFAAHDLVIFDAEELETHGGSLRIYARPEADTSRPVATRILDLRHREEAAGFLQLDAYLRFSGRVHEAKRKLLGLLIAIKGRGQRIAGYGAPGKGNTLLNYCGIRGDFLDFTVDKNPYKHGKFLPGTHIPIFAPSKLDEARPDYILILPWNLKDEIIAQLAHTRTWGAQFIVPIPEAVIVP